MQMSPMFLLAYLIITFVTEFAQCRVVIIKPFHPFYVQVGEKVSLTCKSGNRRTLQWLRQTSTSNWNELPVNATVESGFIIQTLRVEPTQEVESTLIKPDFRLSDGGMYTCQDADAFNSYSTWITALKIYKNDIIHPYNPSAEDNVKLYCNMTGFLSNIPEMGMIWSHSGTVVSSQSNKYAITNKGASMGLMINRPGPSDVGDYMCSFTLGTDGGPLTFKNTVSFNVTGFPNAGSRSLSGIQVNVISTVLSFIFLALNLG